MKVVSRPIDVYSWTDMKGQIHPMMFRLEEDDTVKKLKIDRIVSVTKEKLAGNIMMVYTCQSEIRGILRPYELKYELSTCKWMLFKI